VPGGSSRERVAFMCSCSKVSNQLFELLEASSWPMRSSTKGSTPIHTGELVRLLKPWPRSVERAVDPWFPFEEFVYLSDNRRPIRLTCADRAPHPK